MDVLEAEGTLYIPIHWCNLKSSSLMCMMNQNKNLMCHRVSENFSFSVSEGTQEFTYKFYLKFCSQSESSQADAKSPVWL